MADINAWRWSKTRLVSRDDLWEYIEFRMNTGGPQFNPVYFLVEMMGDEANAVNVRLSAAHALIDRLIPKLRQTEIKGDQEAPVKLKVSLQWDNHES